MKVTKFYEMLIFCPKNWDVKKLVKCFGMCGDNRSITCTVRLNNLVIKIFFSAGSCGRRNYRDFVIFCKRKQLIVSVKYKESFTYGSKDRAKGIM